MDKEFINFPMDLIIKELLKIIIFMVKVNYLIHLILLPLSVILKMEKQTDYPK